VTRRTRRINRRRTFTARAIAALKPEAHAVDWFDRDTPGLAIHVSPGGSKAWYLFYTKGRTVRRVKLGGWPATELAKARQLARHERDRIETEGADPAHERREARDVFTVAALCRLYLEQHAKTMKRTWKDDEWRIERYVLPPGARGPWPTSHAATSTRCSTRSQPRNRRRRTACRR
jgi:hypothetical protein